MIEYTAKNTTGDEFFVIDLTNEPVRIDFQKQVEDIIISSPHGDILIGWDYADPKEFTSKNCMILREGDKLKEISKWRCTHFYMMPVEKIDTPMRVYITSQR